MIVELTCFTIASNSFCCSWSGIANEKGYCTIRWGECKLFEAGDKENVHVIAYSAQSFSDAWQCSIPVIGSNKARLGSGVAESLRA